MCMCLGWYVDHGAMCSHGKETEGQVMFDPPTAGFEVDAELRCLDCFWTISTDCLLLVLPSSGMFIVLHERAYYKNE
jgi:hypothetical protein